MAQYNLTKRQRQIVQELVQANEAGNQDEFNWAAEMGSENAIEIGGKRIRANESDLRQLEKQGLVTLTQWGSGGWAGSLCHTAFEAVAAGFIKSEPASTAGAVQIGNYIEKMSGGSVQGAAGSQIRQHQTINDPQAMLELFRRTTDDLTVALSDQLSPQQLRAALNEVTAVQEAVESGVAKEVSMIGHVRSIGQAVLSALDVGDKLGGSLQALILLGPWADMAFRLMQHAIHL